jgi:hypothetical protein
VYREIDREDREVGWDDDMSRFDDDEGHGHGEGDDDDGDDDDGDDDDIRRLLAETPPHHARHLQP